MQWQSLPGRPHVRTNLIQKFYKAGGFRKVYAYMTSSLSTSDESTGIDFTWLGGERLLILMKAVTSLDPTFKNAESGTIRAEVMRQLLMLPEDTLKKESTDYINNLLTAMRPKSKNDPNFKAFNLFWLEHTAKMMNCNSILLKLFAWDQMHEITREATRTRPTPSEYTVSNAGTAEVNGIYRKLPPKDNASPNDPPMYRKEAISRNEKTFTIVRCNMRSSAKWWYLSIVDPQSPGGVKDVDYYQHRSSVDQHSEPPELNWDTINNSNLGKAPAPLLTRMARTPDPDGFNETVLCWIEEQKLIEKIFGPAIHREIVSRSKSLVLLLVEENRLDDESAAAIFRVGMTHQEDDIVEEIFGLLATCSRYMNDDSYKALMDNALRSIHEGGTENIQRMTTFLKKIHGECLSQMKSVVAKGQLANVVWALHQHPLFVPSPTSSSKLGAVEDLLLLCLQGDPSKAIKCLGECCEMLQDFKSNVEEKAMDKCINTIQFFLSNHFSLGIDKALTDENFHSTLIAELHRFVASHFPPDSNLSKTSSQPPSPSGKSSNSSIESLAKRLLLIRCAYGVSQDASMSFDVLKQIWDNINGPLEREQLYLFLRNSAASLPSLDPVFDTSQCLQIFESLLCSKDIDWTTCGPEAYRCFEAYLSNLHHSVPESTQRLGRDTLWNIALMLPHQAVAEEAVGRLLKSYLDSSQDINGENIGGGRGPYAELLDRVFDKLQSVLSTTSSTDTLPHSVVSRCITLLTGLLGKSKVKHDTPHGARGSLFRIKITVRYQEIISTPTTVYQGVNYHHTRGVSKYKSRSHEKTMEIEVHPMHSLQTLKEKIMDKAIVTQSLRAQSRASRKVDIRFCNNKLQGSMLPLSHFGIGNNSIVSALLSGEDGADTNGNYDDYHYDYYSRNNIARATVSHLDDDDVSRCDDAIIGELTKEENFNCLLSLVELLDGQSEEASALANRLWTLLMSIPTQPTLLLEVETQFHHSKDGQEGLIGWENLLQRDLSANKSVVYRTYILQIMDGMLMPAPELQQDYSIQVVIKDRFITTGGFTTTLASFVNSDGTSPIGKMFLSIALHILHHCLFDTPEELNGDSSDDNIDLDTSNLSNLSIGNEEVLTSRSASQSLIAQVQQSSSAVLDKLLTVAYNAAMSGESEIVKDALFTISSLLESPAIAAQLTSSPQAKGLLTAVLRSSSRPVRHMATNFAVQVGRSQPVVIEWLLAEIEIVTHMDKHCYNLFKALSVLVCYIDDPRNVSGLSLDLFAIGNCLSSKLMIFKEFDLTERLRQKQFELDTDSEGEKSMLLGSLELLKSVISVSEGYSALLNTALGKDIISIFMQDFLCPLPQHQKGADKIPVCDTKQLRAAAFAVLTACIKVVPEHCSTVITHIHALSMSSTAVHFLKHEWGLQVAHDLKKPDIEFSGLRNHGCTCYLNSLLQQLFMNRNFRKTILSVPLKEIYRSTLWHLDDVELVGRQYEFEWANGDWHHGQITHFDNDTKLHTIQYLVEGQHKSVLDIRQGSLRRETGRVRAVGLSADDQLSERESHAVAVLEQLQRTFCYMEKSEKRHFDPKLLIDACKTLNLEFNVYHQNDASELLDKLLDRLETAMKGKPTGGIDMYAELNAHTFGGKMLYQKIPKDCSAYETDRRDCGHWQGTRDEVFFKTEVAVRSCEKMLDALEHVVEGELMDGDNKIMCDVCNEKKATVRRTCFGTLPNCLIVHLKRFDLDYETFETVKLNTRMEFATKLNMYKYTKEGIEAAEEEQQSEEPPLLQRASSKSDTGNDIEAPPVDMEQYEYELQGVLVHSGVAQGGHYYSYIRDTDVERKEDKWYLFDDDEVAPFSPSNIPEQCFGGKFSVSGQNSSNSSDDGMDRHSNALLLFYNKVRPRDLSEVHQANSTESSAESKMEVSTTCNCRSVDGYDAFSPEVGHSNARHILTKYLIDIDLHNFVRSLLSTITTTALTVSSSHVNSLVTRGVTFGCHFLLDIVLHCRDRKGSRQWVNLLSEIFAARPETSIAFLQEFVFAKNFQLLKEYLLMCGDSLARSTFVQLLSGAVAVVVPDDVDSFRNYEHLLDSDLLHVAMEHRKQGYSGVGPPLLVLLIRCLRGLLQHAPNYLQTCDELFGVMRTLAEFPAICSYMLHLELVPLLLYFINGGGKKKIDMVKEFYEATERPLPNGHLRNIGMESHLHHSTIFDAVAAIIGVPQQPKADLLEDSYLTSQARQAFVEIFEQHGQGTMWTTRDVLSYLEKVEEKSNKMTLEARAIIERYGADHSLSLDGFLRYTSDRAYYNPKAVWKVILCSYVTF